MSDKRNFKDTKFAEYANFIISKIKKFFSKENAVLLLGKIKVILVLAWTKIKSFFVSSKNKAVALYNKVLKKDKSNVSHESNKKSSSLTILFKKIVGTVLVFFVSAYRSLKRFFAENKRKNAKKHVLESKKEETRVSQAKRASLAADNENTKAIRVPNRNSVTKISQNSGNDDYLSDFGVPAPDMNKLQKRTTALQNDYDEPVEEKSEASVWDKDRRPFFLVSIGVAVCKLSIVLVLLVGFACLGVGLGIVRAYIASAPELNVEKIENNDRTSYIYDINGDLITEYYNLENRSWASYDEIPTMFKYAVVASEDESFFEHDGFNFKRIVAAALSQVAGGSVAGGSTITQQVLKLTLLTSQQTYKRKIQEIYLAYQLEKEYDKEEILEWYINIMPMGGLLYGVKSAAEDYFGKELNELDLRECAVLAGMTNAPTMYNPRLCMLSVEEGGYGESGRLKLYKRANYVLTQMYSVGFINEQEYNDAIFDTEDLVSEQLTVKKTSSNYTYEHKYYVEYVLDELVERIMEVFDWEGETGREQAYSYIRTGGLHIYTALDVEKQTAVENAVYSFKKWPTFKDPNSYVSVGGIEQPQCAAVVIDNITGYIAALVGGRSEPTIRMGLNRTYQSLLPLGSCIKPLSVYAPALDQGLLSNMVIMDVPVPIDGWYSVTGFPKNFDVNSSYKGPTSVSYGLVKSLNIPTARILLNRLGIATSASYLRAMNFTETAISDSASDMSLGSKGGELVNSAAAYATLANDGIYRTPLSIIKIVDKDGEDIFTENDQEMRRVFKSATAYIITQWMHRATQKPESAIYVELDNKNIEICGKTGTNENTRGIGYMGYSRYYTCALWMGHDDFTPSFTSDITALYWATPLWLDIMNPLHEGLADSKIYPEVDSDVIEVTVCAVSGKLPNGDVCEHDQGGYGTRTELFIKGTEPTEVCDMHFEVKYCKESGLLANKYCTDDCIEVRTAVKLEANSEYFKLHKSETYEYKLYQYFPIYYVDDVPYIGILETDTDGNITIKEVKQGNHCFCTVHNQTTNTAAGKRKELQSKTEAYLKQIKRTLNQTKYKNNISTIQTEQIDLAIALLEAEVNAPLWSIGTDDKVFSLADAQLAYDALTSLFESIISGIDAKLDAKAEYSITVSATIAQITEKLNSSKYASVIKENEIQKINEYIDSLNVALNAPIKSDDPEEVLFDIEVLESRLSELNEKSESLFADLDDRLSGGSTSKDEKVLLLKKTAATENLASLINSQYAIVVNALTGNVVSVKNSDTKIFPADVTSVMTAVVAYEYVKSNDINVNTEYVTFNSRAVDFATSAGLSSAEFQVGEIVALRDVFYGAVFSSGADAALMLAEYCYGSEAEFVKAMNSKAQSMGLKNTYFVNCTGAYNGSHYTTAEDMAVMLDYAYKYDFLKAIMQSDSHTYAKTNLSGMRYVKSMLTNFRTSYNYDIEASKVNGAATFGGKTGQFATTGCTVATFACNAKGDRYIVIVGGADSRSDAVEEMLRLYNEYTKIN